MSLAVKFISGKYQGGEFPIPEEGILWVGRASELDLVLVEDMVSRKHAKLTCSKGGGITIEDLGSTNGTFVNGEKIQGPSELRVNDRVLIGTSILKIISAKELIRVGKDTDINSLKEMMEEIAEAAPKNSSMSGDLEEVPIPDLLQLFATNRKTGVLSVTGARVGKLYLKEGQIRHAVIGGEVNMSPIKALCRMVSWRKGEFELEDWDERIVVPDSLTESTESLLIDALRQLDEIRRVLPQMPQPQAVLKLVRPLQPKLRDLSPAHLDTLQLVHNHGRFKTVIDKSPLTDHQTIMCIHSLLKESFLEVAERSS